MAKAEYKNAGRKFFPRVIFEIGIERVAAGESLISICEDPGMPCHTTFRNALAEDVILQAEYAAAMRVQVERRAAKTTT
jgi:hypothetical protein